MQKILLILIFSFYGFLSYAQVALRGKVVDGVSNENLTGATVLLKAKGTTAQTSGVAVGLDGTFVLRQLPVGVYTITIRHTGYQIYTKEINHQDEVERVYTLREDPTAIDAVYIQGLGRGTDAEARRMEQLSANVINVISAKQIELSPDVTVANVVQRVSGLSIERNANGDPQYAIVRGMNKRYNNSLVNGIKVPSPDNDNRFVPLDIFPAVFLEKLTVSKSLSADMEADAIGGTIDMIMKSAPARRLFEVDIQAGANSMSQNGKFITYDRSEVYRRSPAEYFGPDYEAIPSDFSTLMFTPIRKNVLPDITASGSYGDRFLSNQLGVLLGASFQNSYRPNRSYFYDPEPNVASGNALNLNEYISRQTSTQQQRMAFHAKIDYDLSEEHNLSLYGGQYMLNEFRVREQYRRENFTAQDNYPVYPTTRITNTYQTISIADLRGEHQVSNKVSLDWNAVYSLAKNELPDDGVFMRLATWDNRQNMFVNEEPYFQDSPNSRAWERNQDQDMSLYLNSTYRPVSFGSLEIIKFGGLYRHKLRDNYYNYYKYNSIATLVGVRGEGWINFGDLPWDSFTNGYGDGNNSSLVYDANESIAAAYVHTNWELGRLAVQAGLRGEHTTQGYEINPQSASSNATELSQTQNYLNLFPSVSLKYVLNDNTWLKTTYYKAISRPGFFEIVPTVRSAGGGDSFYSERGNPDLRPTIGHNIDVRYELFPTLLDQVLVGVFYKKLIDPIEYGFPQVTDADSAPNIGRILPQNFGNATNIGVELDYTRYFRNFGVRLNYTYTSSSITTAKLVQSQESGSANRYSLVNERRSLQGQSNHVGNLSLLYKNVARQWDAQVVLNYTGKRLAVVSPYQGTDHFMSPMAVLDFSVEKGFNRFVVFAKANNLLNTPYKITVDRGLSNPESFYPHQENPTEIANVREDIYGLSFRLGVRFKL